MTSYLFIISSVGMLLIASIIKKSAGGASVFGILTLIVLMVGLIYPIESKITTIRINKIVHTTEFEPQLGIYRPLHYYLLGEKWYRYDAQLDCITDSCVLKRCYGITGLGVEMEFTVMVICY